MTEEEIETFLDDHVASAKRDDWENFLSERGDVLQQRNQDTDSRWYQKSMKTQMEEMQEAGQPLFGDDYMKPKAPKEARVRPGDTGRKGKIYGRGKRNPTAVA
jgi:hypothetical protein